METNTDYKKEAELWKAKFDLMEAMYKKAEEYNSHIVAEANKNVEDYNRLLDEVNALKKEKKVLNLRLTMQGKKVDKLTAENKKLNKELREVIETNHELHYELYGKQ